MIPEMSTHELNLPEGYKIHLVFHAWLLKPVTTNNPELFPARKPPCPEPVFPEEGEYEVEKVLDHRKVRNGLEFLVHWLRYPELDDSWVKKKDIHSLNLIQEYWTQIEEEN